MKYSLPEGYKVFVTHFRKFADQPFAMTLFDAKSEGLDSPLHSGGATECVIVDPEGSIAAQSFSFCSDRDNFNKKIGRDIAIGRALKTLNHARSLICP